MKLLKNLTTLTAFVLTFNTASSQEWTTASTDIYNNNSGNVGIGTTTPATKLHVTSGAGVVGIRFTQSASPTVSAFQVENSSGAKLVSVTKEGFLSVIRPGGSFPSTPTALLDLQTDSDDLIRGYNTGTTGSVFRVTAYGAIYANSHNLYDPGNNLINASSLILTNYMFVPDIAASNGASVDLRLNRDHFGVANVLVGFDETQGYGLRFQVKGKGYFSNNVGINNTDPTAKLDITVSGPTVKGMIIKSATSQTANLMEFQDGTGAALTVMDAAGSLGIGVTEVPTGYMLAVKDGIIAEKVKVKLESGWWPDYVFKSSYPLPTLKEVEAFIAKHNHLPGVPSASKIETDGLDLGEGQAILLKKVEEMTLYIIELSKKVDKLEAENEQMKKERKRGK